MHSESRTKVLAKQSKKKMVRDNSRTSRGTRRFEQNKTKQDLRLRLTNQQQAERLHVLSKTKEDLRLRLTNQQQAERLDVLSKTKQDLRLRLTNQQQAERLHVLSKTKQDLRLRLTNQQQAERLHVLCKTKQYLRLRLTSQQRAERLHVLCKTKLDLRLGQKAERNQGRAIKRLVILNFFWNLLHKTLVMDGHGKRKILSTLSKDREIPLAENSTFEHFEEVYYCI